MTTTETTDSAPDWSQASTPELCCPLCEYNLRGLNQPRCPECGFAFSWSELIRGQSEKHPYLFEHHPDRNIWSFFKTSWNDSQPRQFWKEVNPAQPVRAWRLVLYLAVSNLIVIGLVVGPFAANLWDAWNQPPTLMFISNLTPMGTPPGPGTLRPSPTFWEDLQMAWDMTRDGDRAWALTVRSLLVLSWPWLTLLGLLVFAQSMRQARIKKRHLLRVIAYGCDLGLILPVLILIGLIAQLPGEWFLLLATACAGLTMYRLYFAYTRYMRFHMPFATVLTSQIMVFLVAIIVYLQPWTPR